jgi:Chalcone isomerase-like
MESNMRFFLPLLLVMVLLTSRANAAALEVNGVKFEEAIDIRNSKLVLNGAGTRFRTVVKVYAAGLYVGKRAETLEEVISQSGAKRLTLTMLRDIDSTELGRLFIRSVEDNTAPSDFPKVMANLVRMGKLFSEEKKMLTGDSLTIDWIPGLGTVIAVRGKASEPFKDPEFFAALMNIWLGRAPADRTLKDALLGKKALALAP